MHIPFYKILFFLIVFTLCHCFNTANAQEKDTIKFNNIFIKKNHFLIFNNNNYYFNKDTIILIPAVAEFSIIDSAGFYRQNIYGKIEKYSANSKLLKILISLVFVPGENKSLETGKVPFQKSENPFLSFNGKIIRKVRLVKLPVFGSSVNDTNIMLFENKVIETGNELHISTKDYIIRKNLFFKPNDRIDPVILADNERALRGMSSIEDARILLIQVHPGSDSVDAIVITKDVWSIGLDGDLQSINGFNCEVFDKNFLGFGNTFENTLLIDSREKPASGYKGHFRISNLYGTFIDMDAYYYNYFGNRLSDLKFSRSFLTKKIKWGGGLELSRSGNSQILQLNDTFNLTVPVKYNLADIWAGRQFLVKEKSPDNSMNQFLILSARYKYQNYLIRPQVYADSNQQFYNTKLLLGSITITRFDYYRSNMIYGYGKTEDIPYGQSLQLNAGVETSDFLTRLYTSVSITRAKYISSVGYYSYNLSFGGYFHNESLQNGILSIKINTFTNLLQISDIKFRQFINISYMLGINRYQNEYININGNNGIVGFNSNNLKGIQKLVLDLETVTFLPFSLYEFKFACFGFADIGTLSSTASNIFANNFYTGFGIGFRIRNENLVFKTFQVRLGYYPNIFPTQNYFSLDFSGQDNFILTDFTTQKPDIVEFK